MYETEFRKRLIKTMSNLRHYAYKFTCTGDEIDELMQETMLKALMNSDKFRKDDNFEGWLAVIMRNTHFNINKTKGVTFTEYDTCNERGYCDSSFDYLELKRVVMTLPAELYVPFTLYVEGCKYHEIAEKLCLPLGTVKSRIHTARKRLKAMLKDY